MSQSTRSVLLAAAIGSCSALSLFAAIGHVAFFYGCAVGVATGLACGMFATANHVPRIVRAFAVVAGFYAGAAISLPSVLGPLGLPGALQRLLTVATPVSGLKGLPGVPFLLAFIGTAACVFCLRLGRSTLALLGPVAALVVGALISGSTPIPWWVFASFLSVTGLHLSLSARSDVTGIEPLAGTATEVRRQQQPWRPLVNFVPALSVGLLVVILSASVNPFDLRKFVTPSTRQAPDPNPLSVAAQLRDPSTNSDDAGRQILTVDVEGVDPGRLRVAVLDSYGDSGWRQSALYALSGTNLLTGPVDTAIERKTSRVSIADNGWTGPFRAVPTAGLPLSAATSSEIRYAPAAGMLLLNTPDSRVEYTTVPQPIAAPDKLDVSQKKTANGTGQYPTPLTSCPDSFAIRSLATQLVAGADGPIEKAQRIAAWLKLKRIYDPSAPGGQSLASVEEFLAQPDTGLLRGNFEVFVTAMSLMARCAGVPNRVVVGFPSPGVGKQVYSSRELTAWVDIPVANLGWTPIDPIPTPSEQQQQRDLASQNRLNQTPPTTKAPTTTVPLPVAAIPADSGSNPVPLISLSALIAGFIAIAFLLQTPALLRRRRRRIADPSAAVLAAWDTVTDDLLDRRLPLMRYLTPLETARITVSRLPARVTRLLTDMVPLVDRARYGGSRLNPDDAALAWAYVDEIRSSNPRNWWAMLIGIRRPDVVLRRLFSTRNTKRKKDLWKASLPESVMLDPSDDRVTVPGMTIEARIAAGSTGTVYRAIGMDTGSVVALKVFYFTIRKGSFEQQRFEWECQIAQMVSGRPNLPVFLGNGMTDQGRPYLASKFYERGTLFSQVQKGGPLSPAEIRDLGLRLSLALETLHQSSVLHTDVKPENVFIDDDGSPVLGDLGSAWLRTSSGLAAAITPPYAAPEVWRGNSPTTGSDLYSLGLTLHYAATGRVPIAGSPPSREDLVDGFGTSEYLPLLETDPRRRPKTAFIAAQLFGAEKSTVVGETTAGGVSLPTPTVAHQRLSATGRRSK